MNEDEIILTTIMNQQNWLCEIITEHWEKISIRAKMHRNKVQTVIEFAPELLDEVFDKEEKE